MIVAVTGANGFIGKHLCAALRSAGHDTRPIVRRDIAESASGSGALHQLLGGADVLIHAAGATRAPSLSALRASNVELTRRVATAARTAGVQRIVFISSQAASGPAATREQPITEDDAPHPVEAYGRSKLDAESIVRACGVAFTIVRPAAVYGPGDHDFAAMFRLASRGVALHPGNRDHWLSVVHVHDAARVIIAAMTSPAAAGREYFVANPSPVTWNTLFDLAARAAGTRLRLNANVPFALVAAAGLAGDAIAQVAPRTPLLSSGKIALSRPRYWICSAARAARELGITPSIDLAEGLAETHRWYAVNGWL